MSRLTGAQVLHLKINKINKVAPFVLFGAPLLPRPDVLLLDDAAAAAAAAAAPDAAAADAAGAAAAADDDDAAAAAADGAEQTTEGKTESEENVYTPAHY